MCPQHEIRTSWNPKDNYLYLMWESNYILMGSKGNKMKLFFGVTVTILTTNKMRQIYSVYKLYHIMKQRYSEVDFWEYWPFETHRHRSCVFWSLLPNYPWVIIFLSEKLNLIKPNKKHFCTNEPQHLVWHYWRQINSLYYYLKQKLVCMIKKILPGI